MNPEMAAIRRNAAVIKRAASSRCVSQNTKITVSAPRNSPIIAANKATKELTERLTGRKDPLQTDPFPAQWKTVDLARDRKLDLEPGDCELMEGLKKEVLPKLSVKVLADRVSCTPHDLSIQTPQLTVSALVPLPKADDATAADRR